MSDPKYRLAWHEGREVWRRTTRSKRWWMGASLNVGAFNLLAYGVATRSLYPVIPLSLVGILVASAICTPIENW